MANSKHTSIWLIVGSILALTALLAGLYFGGAFKPPLTNLQSATLYPADFRPIANFQLQTQSQQSFTLADLEDKWSLLFFGFTNCPDICPNTLHILKQVSAQLQTSSKQLQIIMVSVDPVRDHPQRLQEYLAYFDPTFIGLSGDDTQLTLLTRSLGVFYSQPEKTEQDNYLVEHSAGIFLVNPSGKPQALFSTPHDATQISHDVSAILSYF